MRRLAEPKRLMERPLQGFADPDFAGGGTSDPPAEAERRSVTRPASRYFRDGNAAQAELRDLPRLPGTRAEGIALVKKLGGDGTSVLFGRDASETRLRQLDADGSLRRARVVAFSTHGLVAGELKNLSQPALALSLPGTGADPDDDGLLTSSEAATLHLNADWVLLSACNTASPDGGNAEGLSGLARAFLFAGARSLLVSHWRVSDAATAVIIGGLFDAGRGQASKAQALRRASLAVLDDATDPEFSDPASWAPFVVIGSPD